MGGGGRRLSSLTSFAANKAVQGHFSLKRSLLALQEAPELATTKLHPVRLILAPVTNFTVNQNNDKFWGFTFQNDTIMSVQRRAAVVLTT